MALLSSITSSPQSVSIALVSVLFLIFIARRVYSVYFGPLSQFPGPKLAAATLWYEFYYDVILQGRYTFKIKDLHQKYAMRRPLSLNKRLIESLGPIIRLSPNELHIDEPDYYEKLYS
jgi:hypothetical protein